MTATLLALPNTKRCTKCDEVKLHDQFHKNGEKLASHCKSCRSTREKARQREDRASAFKNRERYAYYLFSNMRKNAKTKGVKFELNQEDIHIPACCPMLGIPLIRTTEPSPNQASIDRIKPELGYVKGNIQVISRLANMIKSNASADQILAVGRYMKEMEDG